MKQKRISKFIVIGLLVLAVVPTVFFLQTRKEIRQHADTNQVSVTVSPLNASAGSSLTVQWALNGTTTTSSTTQGTKTLPTLAFVFTGESNAGGFGANASATADELTPTASVKILNNTSLVFEDLAIGTNNLLGHTGLSEQWSTRAHGFELALANAVKAHAFPNTTSVYLIKTGQGQSVLSQWNEGGSYWTTFQKRITSAKAQIPSPRQWIVWYSLGINDHIAGTSVATFKADTLAHIQKIKAQLPDAIIVMTQFQAMGADFAEYNNVLSDIAKNEPNVYVVDTTGAELASDNFHFTYAGLKTVGGKMVTITNTALAQLYPSDTQTTSSSTQTGFTGAETLQLIKIDTHTAVGSAFYLNCASVSTTNNNTDHNTMPASGIASGQCTYLIPDNTPAGSYMMELLASDGTTILGESSPVTIQGNPTPSISAWPNPCLLTDYGVCSTLISWNVPNATNPAEIKVKLKEYPDRLFANAPYGSNKAGWITAKGVTFELYVDSSNTPVSSVFVKGVDSLTAPSFTGGTPPPFPTGNPPLPSITPPHEDIIGCTSDADCGQSDHPGSTAMKCYKYQDFPGSCKPVDMVCTQTTTTACHKRQPNCSASGACTGAYFPPECVDFPSTCVVPPGWAIQPTKQSCSGTNDTNCGTDMTCIKGCSAGPADNQADRYFCATAMQAEAQPYTACPQ